MGLGLGSDKKKGEGLRSDSKKGLGIGYREGKKGLGLGKKERIVHDKYDFHGIGMGNRDLLSRKRRMRA